MNGLLEEWKKTADKMRPDARATDIFGGLFLAERVFADSMVQVKNLRIFSDLRHNVKIDLERKEVIDERLIRVVKKVYGVPDLKGVRVLMHGVHGYGKTPAYFYSLKKLFELYLREAQAELVTFSPFQEVQNE